MLITTGISSCKQMMDRTTAGEAVDPAWYNKRYPDVAAAGVDPGQHYRSYGHAEGRFPNAAAELEALGDVVDCAWYLARYPDVAQTKIDPVEHYLIYGRGEGRYPNVDREPRAIWCSRFDALWYSARNPDLGIYRDDPLEHFRRIGLLEGRAPNSSEESRDTWRQILDSSWYLARNPDVAERGLDPLEHFITEGIIDRRRPNASVILDSEEVTSAKIDRLKGGDFGKEVALFVTHAIDGRIKPHVAHHISGLKLCGIECALIVACDSEDLEISSMAFEVSDHVFRRTNAGFDFAAWSHVLRNHSDLFYAETLYLINDSMFGPTHPDILKRLITRIRMSEADLIGLTDNSDRGWHVQSYFLALKRRFTTSEAGRTFFGQVVAYSHKNDVVNEYETQLARYAIDHGFSVEVLFPTPGWLDATLHNWRKLLRAGLPYLKIGTARDLVPNVETAGWRAELAARGYDISLAELTLEQLAEKACRDTASKVGGTSQNAGAALVEMHAFLASDNGLIIAECDAPLVSFIAVVDGNPARALRFIRAIVENGCPSFELIIVDNASIDDTLHVLERLRGATLITNVARLPIIRAAHQAIAIARADNVILLHAEEYFSDLQYLPRLPLKHSDLDQEFTPVLQSIFPTSSVIRYRAHSTMEDVRWRSFSFTIHEKHLGAAYVFRRREAQSSLEQIVRRLEPSSDFVNLK